MTHFRAIMVGCLAAALLGCHREQATEPQASEGSLIDAEAASKAACSMCHAYPDPSLLEKRAWMPVLNRMKLFSGLEKPNAARMNNPELAANTNVFPANPLFPKDVWPAIENFYLANAPDAQPAIRRPSLPATLTLFKPERLASVKGPTTTFVSIDESARAILFADAETETLSSIGNDGSLVWSLPVSNIITSLRSVGSVRYLIGIGDYFPSDDLLGQVLLHNPAATGPEVTEILGGLPRTTHLEPADLNGDGQTDFALSMFGNLLGRFSWFEQRNQGWEEHLLFDKPGALKSLSRDFNQDGKMDLAVLVAQATESLILYTNSGAGRFTESVLFQKPPTYGHTDFDISDMNADGQPDFIVVNGDNADFQTQPRPYHGVRIYLAEGAAYKEAWFFPFYGAYRVIARDFDGDGDADIAATSFFPDFRTSTPETFLYLENIGNLSFTASTFEGAGVGRWLAMDAGDVDGDGDIDLVLGAMAEMPDAVPPRLREYWMTQSPSVLLLRNQTR